MDARQYRLPLDAEGANRRAVIDSLCETTLPRKAIKLLKLIYHLEGKGFDTPSVETLAKMLTVDRANVFRALADARAAGVLTVIEDKRPNGRRDVSIYKIEWDKLAALPRRKLRHSPARDRRAVSASPTTPADPLELEPSRNGALPSRFSCEPPVEGSRNATLRTVAKRDPLFIDSNTNTKEPSFLPAKDFSAQRAPTLEDGKEGRFLEMQVSEEGLEAVCLQLKRRGVGRWFDAVKLAMANGYTLAQIGDVVYHFDRMHKIGWKSPSAVLYTRLTTVPPNVSLDDGWAPPAEAIVREQEKQAAAVGQVDAREDADARKKRYASEAAERQRLEAKHGATLDAMNGETLVAALAAINAKPGRWSPTKAKELYRPQLLAWLDSQTSNP